MTCERLIAAGALFGPLGCSACHWAEVRERIVRVASGATSKTTSESGLADTANAPSTSTRVSSAKLRESVSASCKISAEIGDEQSSARLAASIVGTARRRTEDPAFGKRGCFIWAFPRGVRKIKNVVKASRRKNGPISAGRHKRPRKTALRLSKQCTGQTLIPTWIEPRVSAAESSAGTPSLLSSFL